MVRLCWLVGLGVLTVGLAVAEQDSHLSPYCCCNADAIVDGAVRLRSVLDVIVQRPFFRFFKADLRRKCSFWSASLMCSDPLNRCTVCRCDESNKVLIPVELQQEPDIEDIPVDRDLSKSFLPWYDAQTVPWFDSPGVDVASLLQPHHDEFFDLVANPESNTGYVGPFATRVWQAIYAENCFQRAEPSEMCLEESIFYSLLSGLHTSISVHIAKNFYKTDDLQTPYRENCAEMKRRVLGHPDRLRNLQMLFAFVMHAISRISDQLLSQPYNDPILLDAVKRLTDDELVCVPKFNSTLLSSPLTALYVPRMKKMMGNITRLMDCLSCEKCRLWGKLQTLGLATSLNLVTFSHHAGVSPTLQRSEIIALINFARQLSVSMTSLQMC
jgi:ERO1-like protein alpha